MMNKPIILNNLSLSFPQKICFENFNTQINFGNRIGIIGRNGGGKSTLLKMLIKEVEPTSGHINIPNDVVISYVPQTIEEFNQLSGSQRFNKTLSQALSTQPNLLLLDEPTNHLDISNRKSLLRMLRNFPGTLVIVTHDLELLNNCIDTLWHIDNGKINIFTGSYENYMCEVGIKRSSIEQKLVHLDKQRKEMHTDLMQEQNRAAKSKAKGKKSIDNCKWPSVVSKSKALRAQETSGRKKSAIANKKYELTEQLLEMRLPEIIVPKFSINADDIGHEAILSISNGYVGYDADNFIIRDFSLTLNAKDRIAITGDNGTGKTTLVKAILHDPAIKRSGNWYVIKNDNIGYLDQQYYTLNNNHTVFDNIKALVPNWSYIDIRSHLNDFLFRKNEEVTLLANQLSGGEKVRLSLAQIAARSPKLLILDEITNNIDLETRQHLINVLKHYPGAMMVISHDTDFLQSIGIEDKIDVVG
jgi:ATPase subunit of ABC transporter with duplicated ATPase domains